jgi:uncharacterized protein
MVRKTRRSAVAHLAPIPSPEICAPRAERARGSNVVALCVVLLALGASLALAQDEMPPAPPAFPDTVHFHPRGDDGITLEGVLSSPAQGPQKAPGVVICHPHPLYGGTMENGVARGLEQALLKQGLITLRFNFRGVGASTGKFSGKGGEVQDVLGALDFLLKQPDLDRKRVGIAGYSFGSWVGLEAAVKEQERLKFFAGVGFPVAPDTVDFGPAAFIKPATLPMLFVSGDQDAISSVEKIDRLLVLTERNRYAKVVTLPGVDHFYGSADAIAAMQKAVVAFVKPILWPPNPDPAAGG